MCKTSMIAPTRSRPLGFALPVKGAEVPTSETWFHEVKYDGLYEASRVKKFSRKNIVSGGSRRERSPALMAHGRLICLAALSGQPPEPGGSRRKARGVDGGSARRATIRPGHYDVANVRFLLILFFFSSFVR
jgi:hypothetical protein